MDALTTCGQRLLASDSHAVRLHKLTAYQRTREQAVRNNSRKNKSPTFLVSSTAIVVLKQCEKACWKRRSYYLAFALLIATSNAGAQAWRESDAARTKLSELQSIPGYFLDRCDLPFLITDNLYISRQRESTLPARPGDKLIGINGTALGESRVSMLTVLSTIPATDVIQLTVTRGGREFDTQTACANARAYSEREARLLDAIATQDWPTCLAQVSALRPVYGNTADLQNKYVLCAWYGGQLRYKTAGPQRYEALRLAIEENKWDPAGWPEFERSAQESLAGLIADGFASLAASLQRDLDVARQSASATSSEPAPPHRATGTGFLVNTVGTLVTSNHVVEGRNTIGVTCGTNAPVKARISASSRMTDIAILQTDLAATKYLNLALARSAGTGMAVFTLGFPVSSMLGMEPKFTDGAISAMSGIRGEQTFVQISIPVQPGNSGGPVVNDKGLVVGIVAAGAAVQPFYENTGTLPQNVNWAVKAEYAALMFEPPPLLPPTRSREEAIEQTRNALCFIEAE